MARPRTIDPRGEVTNLVVRVPLSLARKLEREAKRRGVSVAHIARERLTA